MCIALTHWCCDSSSGKHSVKPPGDHVQQPTPAADLATPAQRFEPSSGMQHAIQHARSCTADLLAAACSAGAVLPQRDLPISAGGATHQGLQTPAEDASQRWEGAVQCSSCPIPRAFLQEASQRQLVAPPAYTCACPGCRPVLGSSMCTDSTMTPFPSHPAPSLLPAAPSSLSRSTARPPC
jgi:hypothetical protein